MLFKNKANITFFFKLTGYLLVVQKTKKSIFLLYDITSFFGLTKYYIKKKKIVRNCITFNHIII